jgi:hypothetical protein
MRAVMVKVLLPRGRSLPAASLAPPARFKLEGLFRAQERDYGDMKVDAGDAACSMEISGPPEPVVAFLYIRIIAVRSGCA